MKDFIKNFIVERFGENSTITLLATAFIGGLSTGIAAGDPVAAVIYAAVNTAAALIPDKYIDIIKQLLQQGVEANKQINKKAP